VNIRILTLKLAVKKENNEKFGLLCCENDSILQF